MKIIELNVGLDGKVLAIVFKANVQDLFFLDCSACLQLLKVVQHLFMVVMRCSTLLELVLGKRRFDLFP